MELLQNNIFFNFCNYTNGGDFEFYLFAKFEFIIVLK